MPAWETRTKKDSRLFRMWPSEAWIGPMIEVEAFWGAGLSPFSLHFVTGAESCDIGGSFGVGPLAIHIALADCFTLPYDWFDHCHGRDTGFSFLTDFGDSSFWAIHDGFFSVHIWSNGMGWNGDQLKQWPWNAEYGWSFFLHPFQWIFGAERHQADENSKLKQSAVVSMPEGDYVATVSTHRVQQSRRWWKDGWRWHTQVTVENGVPIPGKGTMPYNCGDDSVYSIGSGTHIDERPSSESLAADMVESCMETRGRYGGRGWIPSAGWPEHCVQTATR